MIPQVHVWTSGIKDSTRSSRSHKGLSHLDGPGTGRTLAIASTSPPPLTTREYTLPVVQYGMMPPFEADDFGGAFVGQGGGRGSTKRECDAHCTCSWPRGYGKHAHPSRDSRVPGYSREERLLREKARSRPGIFCVSARERSPQDKARVFIRPSALSATLLQPRKRPPDRCKPRPVRSANRPSTIASVLLLMSCGGTGPGGKTRSLHIRDMAAVSNPHYFNSSLSGVPLNSNEKRYDPVSRVDLTLFTPLTLDSHSIGYRPDRLLSTESAVFSSSMALHLLHQPPRPPPG